MVATTEKAVSKSSQRALARSLGYDFALLGLTAREARVSVIREAAQSTAARIHDAAMDQNEHDVMLSDLAISTYRLLDPRKRSKMLERVQLCLLSEEDLQSPQKSRASFMAAEDSLVAAVLVEKSEVASASAESLPGSATDSCSTAEIEANGARRFGGERLGRLSFSLVAALCWGAATLALLSAFCLATR